MAVDRERIGLVAMEAMDDLEPSPDAELQGVGIIVAVAEGGRSTVKFRFKDQAGNDLSVAVGLQMLGLTLQAIGKGGGR